MMAFFRLASLRHYREFLDHLGYISTFIDVVRFNLEAELGVNNSYSIDLFEHRLAQIIQVNFLNKIESDLSDIYQNSQPLKEYIVKIFQENKEKPFLIYLASQVHSFK